jgi:hypothetical protein
MKKRPNLGNWMAKSSKSPQLELSDIQNMFSPENVRSMWQHSVDCMINAPTVFGEPSLEKQTATDLRRQSYDYQNAALLRTAAVDPDPRLRDAFFRRARILARQADHEEDLIPLNHQPAGFRRIKLGDYPLETSNKV